MRARTEPSAAGGRQGLDAAHGFECASALATGRRETQEDALAIDFAPGAPFGVAVLADGMGGHAAGEVAACIAVRETLAGIGARRAGMARSQVTVPDALREAASAANAAISAHISARPGTRGMGATLLALVAAGRDLYRLSVGDSPLWLWREGTLIRLNEDHSLAPELDRLAREGRMDPAIARTHPDRHCLTSVLMGGSVARVDCPAVPVALHAGDLVLAASDGLESLGEESIAAILRAGGGAPAAAIVAALLEAVAHLDNPYQDNVAVIVLRPVSGSPDTANAVSGAANGAGVRAFSRRRARAFRTGPERVVAQICAFLHRHEREQP